jgi:hypothetical protein
MPTLRIDFQDGFKGELVNLRVNGKTILAGKNVKTTLLTGKASSIGVDVPAGRTEVEVELPEQNLRHSIQLQLDADTHLGISRTERGFEHIERKTPFGYA